MWLKKCKNQLWKLVLIIISDDVNQSMTYLIAQKFGTKVEAISFCVWFFAAKKIQDLTEPRRELRKSGYWTIMEFNRLGRWIESCTRSSRNDHFFREQLTWLPPWLWQGQRPTFLWRSSLLAGESMHWRLCAFRIWKESNYYWTAFQECQDCFPVRKSKCAIHSLFTLWLTTVILAGNWTTTVEVYFRFLRKKVNKVFSRSHLTEKFLFED